MTEAWQRDRYKGLEAWIKGLLESSIDKWVAGRSPCPSSISLEINHDEMLRSLLRQSSQWVKTLTKRSVLQCEGWVWGFAMRLLTLTFNPQLEAVISLSKVTGSGLTVSLVLSAPREIAVCCCWDGVSLLLPSMPVNMTQIHNVPCSGFFHPLLGKAASPWPPLLLGSPLGPLLVIT